MFKENRLAYLATKTTSKTASKSSGLSSIAKSISSAASKAKAATTAKPKTTTTKTTTAPKTSAVSNIAKSIAGTAGAVAANKAVSSTFSAPKTSAISNIASGISKTASTVKASLPSTSKTTSKSSGSSGSSRSSGSSSSKTTTSKTATTPVKAPVVEKVPVEETPVETPIEETPIETPVEEQPQPPAITAQIQEEETFKDKWTTEAEKLAKAQKGAEADYTEAVVDAAEDRYQATQERLQQQQELQAKILEDRNAAVAASAEIERRDAEAAYQKSEAILQTEKERAAQAYQDRLVEQEVANTKRNLQLESALAAMGGFGSLSKNKEMLDQTVSNDRLINSIVFEKETTNKEYTNSLVAITTDYKNDLYKIESNKATAIQSNYDTYLQYVQEIQADMEMSEIEKYEAITTAKASYKKNVAQINQDAFATRYELAKNAKDKIYDLKFRQVDPNVSSIVGFAADAQGNAILDENGNKIEVPTSGSFKLQSDMFGNPLGYFDEATGQFVSYGAAGAASGAIDPSTINSWLNAPSSQGFGAKISYSDGGTPGVHDGLDFTLPGGTNADVKAPVAGTVIGVERDAGNGTGYGNSIIIRDGNGNEHRISHLSSINVAQGQAITASTVLGKQGNTGFSTGTHVDYRIKNANGEYIDPKAFLQNSLNVGSGIGDAGFQSFLQQAIKSDPAIMTDKNKQIALYNAYKMGASAPEAIEAVSLKDNALTSAKELLDKLTTSDAGAYFLGKSGTIPFADWIYSGTPVADFKVQFDNLKSLLSLDNVKFLKGQGQVSDAERRLLADASAKLAQTQTEAEFEKSLRLIVEALSGSAGATEPTTPTQKVDTNDYWVQQIGKLPNDPKYNVTMAEIQQKINEGYSTQEIYNFLISQ